MASQTAAAALYMAGVIVISAMAFEYVEEPANRMIRGWSGRRAAVPAPATRHLTETSDSQSDVAMAAVN